MNRPIGLKRGSRTPFVKAGTYYAKYRDAAEISCHLVNGMLDRLGFPQEWIQHVIWGMVVPDPNIYSIAREVVLGSRLDNGVEAYSVSRACATSLQSATNAAIYYQAFPEDRSVSLVGGAESFSAVKPILTDAAARYFKSLSLRGTFIEKLLRAVQIPMTQMLPIPPSAKEYSTGLTMGEHCELMIKEFKIERK